MRVIDLIIELIPAIICVAVIMPLLIWAYINADLIVEWVVSL